MLTYVKREYPADIDSEVIDICDALSCIPGVTTVGSCCGHGKSPLRVWISLRDPLGAFFLSRCMSKRYWRYGHQWSLAVVDCSDRYPEASYMVQSGSVGEDAYAQATSLADNIIFHLNHKTFIEGYKIPLRLFDVEGNELGENWWDVIKELK